MRIESMLRVKSDATGKPCPNAGRPQRRPKMSLANNASAVARAQPKPRREKMFGEGRAAPARPQRQGAHHGLARALIAPDRGRASTTAC